MYLIIRRLIENSRTERTNINMISLVQAAFYSNYSGASEKKIKLNPTAKEIKLKKNNPKL